MTTTIERNTEKQIPPALSLLARLQAGRSDKGKHGSGLWARSCATTGAVAWAGIAVLARAGVVRIGAIELMFLFAPLVIVPLGMELGRGIGGNGWFQNDWPGNVAQRLQPLGAALAVVAMLLPPGRKAGMLSLGWMWLCIWMAGAEVIHWVSFSWRDASRSATLVRFMLGVARIDLAVGGAWLVASRFGIRVMGIREPIGLLTAVHFHYAGFATATIAAATLEFMARRGEYRWLKYVTLMVAGMPFVVAAGFVISPALKMGAALVFSASVAVLAMFVHACGKQAENATARILLQVAAVFVFAGMVFAGAYAIADFVGSEALPIPQMARTHGIFNAIGFCLPGLLGWLIEYGGRN
jgi:hypothetical protein